MIEAELKARLTHPDDVRAALQERAAAERAVYHDTYFDDDALTLEHTGRELRIRTKIVDEHARHLFTYKEAAVDTASGSKPEHESEISEPDAMRAALIGLGYHPVIELTKHCDNHALRAYGRDVLATVVTVAELPDTFLEIETLVPPEDVDAALDVLRKLLTDLDIDEKALTTELYTAAVAARRAE